MSKYDYNAFLNKYFKGLVLAVFILSFAAGLVVGNNNRKERLIGECLLDGKATKFECKVIVSDMMRVY